MYCKKCGTDAGDAKYCPNCGENIEGEARNGVAIEPGQKTVNKIAYGLIAIFLGWIGIHRFYAGKVASGIGYILLVVFTLGIGSVITSILGLIEGIIALCRESDQYGNIPVYPDKFFV